MLAMGAVDLVVEAGLKPYDVQALMPIIRGAGGIITTWDGGDASMGGRIIAAGDARVHREAMAIFEAIKRSLDPDGIMNPGKMGLAPGPAVSAERARG